MLEYLKPWEWDRLQALSKQGVVKATIIMPVVGYLILFNASLQGQLKLSRDFGFGAEDAISAERLLFLYFGLVAIAVASFWFRLRCPRVIREHGSASEYVDKVRHTATASQFLQMTEWVVLHDNKAELQELRLTPKEAVYMATRQRADYGVAAYMCPDPPEGTEQWKNAGQQTTYALRKNPERFRSLLKFAKGLKAELRRYENAENEVLNDQHDRLNASFLMHRIAVTCLYYLGFVLLAYPTGQVFWQVSKHTFQVAFGQVGVAEL